MGGACAVKRLLPESVNDEHGILHHWGMKRSRSGRRVKPRRYSDVIPLSCDDKALGCSSTGLSDVGLDAACSLDAAGCTKGVQNTGDCHEDESPGSGCEGSGMGHRQSGDGTPRAGARHGHAGGAVHKSGGGGIFKLAAVEILRQERRLMTTGEIARLALKRGLVKCSGKTPEATMASALYTDVKKKKKYSTFVRPKEGLFGLREWGGEGVDIGSEAAENSNDDRSKRSPTTTSKSLATRFKHEEINTSQEMNTGLEYVSTEAQSGGSRSCHLPNAQAKPDGQRFREIKCPPLFVSHVKDEYVHKDGLIELLSAAEHIGFSTCSPLSDYKQQKEDMCQLISPNEGSMSDERSKQAESDMINNDETRCLATGMNAENMTLVVKQESADANNRVILGEEPCVQSPRLEIKELKVPKSFRSSHHHLTLHEILECTSQLRDCLQACPSEPEKRLGEAAIMKMETIVSGILQGDNNIPGMETVQGDSLDLHDIKKDDGRNLVRNTNMVC